MSDATKQTQDPIKPTAAVVDPDEHDGEDPSVTHPYLLRSEDGSLGKD